MASPARNDDLLMPDAPFGPDISWDELKQDPLLDAAQKALIVTFNLPIYYSVALIRRAETIERWLRRHDDVGIAAAKTFLQRPERWITVYHSPEEGQIDHNPCQLFSQLLSVSIRNMAVNAVIIRTFLAMRTFRAYTPEEGKILQLNMACITVGQLSPNSPLASACISANLEAVDALCSLHPAYGLDVNIHGIGCSSAFYSMASSASRTDDPLCDIDPMRLLKEIRRSSSDVALNTRAMFASPIIYHLIEIIRVTGCHEPFKVLQYSCSEEVMPDDGSGLDLFDINNHYASKTFLTALQLVESEPLEPWYQPVLAILNAALHRIKTYQNSLPLTLYSIFGHGLAHDEPIANTKLFVPKPLLLLVVSYILRPCLPV